MNKRGAVGTNIVPFRAEEQLAGSSRTSAAQRRRPELQQSYIVPVLCKAFEIVRLLESSDRALNVNEISKSTGVAKSTTYRILRTLSAYGFMPHGSDGVYSFHHLSQDGLTASSASTSCPKPQRTEVRAILAACKGPTGDRTSQKRLR